THRTGRLIILLLPKVRSCQAWADVMAATNGAESMLRRMLSMRMKVGDVNRADVIRLRHSSSSLAAAIVGAGRPVAGMAITSAKRLLPEPGVGASIKCSGVGPSIISRTKGRSMA